MKKTILFGLLLIFAILLKAESPIITKWNTNINNDGSTQIMIPVFGSYNYTYTKVGDASIMGNGNGGSLGTFTSKIITFPSVGEYIVKISPIAMFKFNFLSPSSNFRNKLTELQQWGTVSWIPDLSYLFYECKNLKITATDIPDFSNVTNMYHMFYFCESLTTIPSANSWNTGSVSNMYGMFRDAISFNQDIGNWDTHNVTNMATMFVNAYVFNKNIGSWNTGKVTSMLQMFGNAKSFNQNIGAWNTSNVTDMQAMFSGATAYNQIMGNWNTGKVTTMYGMFSNALAFNHDIGNWNTSNVTSMLVMFRDAKAFDQNIGKWPLKIGVDLTNLFTSSGMSCENYSRTLKGWAENNITPNNIIMSAQDVKYGPAGLTHRTELVIGKGWNISGDSFDPACILNLAANDFTNKNKSLSVYPNPVNSILNFSEEVSNIKITDVSGKVVKQNFASGKSVDIADLKKGIYIITSTTKSGDSSSKKIIKD